MGYSQCQSNDPVIDSLRFFVAKVQKHTTIFDNSNSISYRRSKWHSNPHFRGSYSNYTLESDALDVSAEKLAEPISTPDGRPLIQFAGEATNANHFGSVHGAIESGWREANRLIQLYT